MILLLIEKCSYFQNKQSEILNENSISPPSNPFKRINFLYLNFYSVDESLSILENFGNLSMLVDYVYLSWDSTIDGESLSNPLFYNGGVSFFNYQFNKIHILSEDFFNNMNQIKPKDIWFELNYGISDGYFDIIKTLK